MFILEDTRQQQNKHIAKHDYFASEGIGVVRTKLPFGDYAFWGSVTAVDTKANVEEIAQNIGGKEHVWIMNRLVLSVSYSWYCCSANRYSSRSEQSLVWFLCSLPPYRK